MLYPKINISCNFRNSELDTYDMDELVMNMKFLQHKFRVYLSENYSRTLSLGAGLESEIMTPRKVMYLHHDAVDMDYRSVNTLGSFAYIHYDNLNKANFPNKYNTSNWWGAGIRYSIDTNLGPLSFDVSSSNISKSVNLYFSIGHYF